MFPDAKKLNAVPIKLRTPNDTYWGINVFHTDISLHSVYLVRFDFIKCLWVIDNNYSLQHIIWCELDTRDRLQYTAHRVILEAITDLVHHMNDSDTSFTGQKDRVVKICDKLNTHVIQVYGDI